MFGQGLVGHPEVALKTESIGGFCTEHDTVTHSGSVWRTQWTGAERDLVFLLGWARAYPSLSMRKCDLRRGTDTAIVHREHSGSPAVIYN